MRMAYSKFPRPGRVDEIVWLITGEIFSHFLIYSLKITGGHAKHAMLSSLKMSHHHQLHE